MANGKPKPSDPTPAKKAATRAPVVAPKAPPAIGFKRVIVMDGDHVNGEVIDIPEAEFGRRIYLNGVFYDHKSDAPDGTWQFAPAGK